MTGDDGSTHASLPLGGGVLYVIPRDAPFAVARVSDNDPLVEVRVSRARGSLELLTRTDAGAPVGEVRLLLRYNAELIPTDVAPLIERSQGLAFATDDSGVAPVRLNLKTGDNQVAVKFRSR